MFAISVTLSLVLACTVARTRGAVIGLVAGLLTSWDASRAISQFSTARGLDHP
jgi:hypothetical protein